MKEGKRRQSFIYLIFIIHRDLEENIDIDCYIDLTMSCHDLLGFGYLIQCRKTEVVHHLFRYFNQYLTGKWLYKS